MEGQTFYETFNLENVKYLTSLSDKELITLLKENNGINKNGIKPKITPEYATSVRYFLRKIIKYEAEMPVRYKYGNGCDSGRLYSDGLALQSISNNIRSFILDDAYNDYDIINAHPTILLHLAKNNPEISSCNYLLLEKYVNNRDAILLEHNFTKQDLLVALYSDRYTKHTGFLKGLHCEFTALKKVLTKGITTDNDKNPNSSCLSKLICEVENNILQSVLNSLLKNPKECSLCFDGFLSKENITVESLDKLTEEYSIRWKIKPRNNTIEIPQDFVADEYLQVKTEFETNNFMVTYPLSFYHYVDGNWRVYNEHNFTTVNKTLPKIDGKPFIASWLCDPMRLEYNKTDFYPFNKNPANNPKNVFNTFVPFTRLKNIDDPMDKDFPRFLEMLNLLTHSLCERNETMQHYFIQYIAHIVQFPEILPGTIIYLKGEQGIGKDTIVDVIELLIDNSDYTIRIKSLERLFKQFNFAVGGRLVIDVNEMTNSDAIKYKEDIKDLSTLKTNLIENKGIDGFTKVRNTVRMIIKSNNNKPVCVSESSRREFVVEGFAVSKDPNECSDFFEEFYTLLENKNIINNLFRHFNNLDLTDFNVRKPPRGQLFSELSVNNVKPIFHFLRELNIDKSMPHHKDGNVLYSVSELIKDYTDYCKKNNITKNLILSPQSMNAELAPLKEVIVKKQTSVNRVKGYYWKFDEAELNKYINDKYFRYETKIATIDEADIISGDECEISDDDDAY